MRIPLNKLRSEILELYEEVCLPTDYEFKVINDRSLHQEEIEEAKTNSKKILILFELKT